MMNNILNSFIGGAIKNKLQSMGIEQNMVNLDKETQDEVVKVIDGI